MAISNDISEPTLRRSARIAERIARQADAVPSEDTNQDLITDSQDEQPGDNYVATPNQPTANDLLSDWAKKIDETPGDEISADQIDNTTRKPEISIDDYLNDPHFGPIYNYLRNDKLTGNDDVERNILLTAENYYIENDLLFKVSLPTLTS